MNAITLSAFGTGIAFLSWMIKIYTRPLRLMTGFVSAACLLLVSQAAYADKPEIYTSSTSNRGADGYDVVSYLTEQRAVKGSKKYIVSYKGADWLFSSQSNKTAFENNPAKYAPQYGGYCAWAVASNYTAKGDPEAWTVYNNKLYLNYNKSVRASWQQDKPGNIRKGNRNWPGVLKE